MEVMNQSDPTLGNVNRVVRTFLAYRTRIKELCLLICTLMNHIIVHYTIALLKDPLALLDRS